MSTATPCGKLTLMTRSELTVKLAHRIPSLSAQDIAACVSCMLDAITTELAGGGRVEIRGFGSLSVNYREARMARNPATGAKVNVPGKHTVRFKAGLELRERVNRYANSQDRTVSGGEKSADAAELCFGCVYYPPNLPPYAYSAEDWEMLQARRCSFDHEPGDNRCQTMRKTSCSLIDLRAKQP